MFEAEKAVHETHYNKTNKRKKREKDRKYFLIFRICLRQTKCIFLINEIIYVPQSNARDNISLHSNFPEDLS